MSRVVFDAQSWIEQGFKALKNEGLNKFSVEAMANQAGITKGSFYWHFRDRETFFKAIVDNWLERQHAIIEDFSQHGHSDPKQQLWDIMQYILHKNTDHDIAMRSWVQHYDYAHLAVKQIDRIRIEYLQKLFRKMGLDKDKAKLRAHMLYFYQVGEHAILVHEKQSVRTKLNSLHYQMLVADAL